MSRYDNDEAVVALLRDTVPPVPEVADRIGAIRARAGRQRAALWTQAIGAVASVLLVVGVATAVGTSGRETGPVAPLDDPIAAAVKSFEAVESLRFEASLTPVGTPKAPPGGGISDEQFAELLRSRIVGAGTRDGDAQVDGDLSLFMLFAFEEDMEFDLHVRFVDGESYRALLPHETAPEGKKWVREEGDSQTSGDDLTRWLRVGAAFADDVRYVGQNTVRDVPVAEYRFTLAERVTRFADVELTFALDAENRIRRVAAEIPWTGILTMLHGSEEQAEVPGGDATPVRFELLIYGYGDRIEVERPPADEVVSAEQLRQLSDSERDEESRQLEECLSLADTPKATSRCFEELRESSGSSADSEVVGGWTEYPPPPGSATLSPSPAP